MKIKYENFKDLDSELQETKKTVVNYKLIIINLIYNLFTAFLIAFIIYFNVFFFFNSIYVTKKRATDDFCYIMLTVFLNFFLFCMQIANCLEKRTIFSFSEYVSKYLQCHLMFTLGGLTIYTLKIGSILYKIHEKIGSIHFILNIFYIIIIYYTALSVMSGFLEVFYENDEYLSVYFKIYSFLAILFLVMYFINLGSFYFMGYSMALTALALFFGFVFTYLGSLLAYKTIKDKIYVMKFLHVCLSIMVILNMVQELLYFEKISAFLRDFDELSTFKYNFFWSDEMYNPTNISIYN